MSSILSSQVINQLTQESIPDQMALVNFPKVAGFTNFDDRIRFHELFSSYPATRFVSKPFPPSGELSCRRMNFLCRGRGDFFDQTHISYVRRTSHESADTNECIHSLEQEEEEASRSNRMELCIIGLESALNCQSKWLMAAFFVGLLLWRRDGAASWAATGSVINFVSSKILKKTLNQERPVSHFSRRSDPGMPSSHAQSIFYGSTLAIILMVQYQGFNGFTLLLCPLIFSLASYLSWLRVSHQFHTINQVKVGAVIGAAFSILWIWLWEAFVLNAFISYSWVGNVVTSGAVSYCLGLIISISQNFFNRIDERGLTQPQN